MDLESILLIIIALIAFYITVSILIDVHGRYKAPSIPNDPKKITGGDEPKATSRPDNLEVPIVDPFGKNHRIKRRHYDEYDDADHLVGIDHSAIKTFDNIVVDGYNFIHRFREDFYDAQRKYISVKETLAYITQSVKLLTKHFPDKNIYFVLKDPEKEQQVTELLNELEAKNVKEAHKKFFKTITDAFPKTRFVVAYGEEKYRDDYTAIWLADSLSESTILLSRDRYRDVQEMRSPKVKFAVYGKDAGKINKILNKPFSYVTKGAVNAALVGYSFTRKRKSGFYERTVNKKSNASDLVYIFNVKK